MGWTYNTPEGTPTEGPQITAITTTFTGFSLILVCLRTYVRGWIVKAFGHGKLIQPTTLLEMLNFSLDDWMIMVSWVCSYSIS